MIKLTKNNDKLCDNNNLPVESEKIACEILAANDN